MIVSDGSRERKVCEMSTELVNKWTEGIDECLKAEGDTQLVLSAYATAAYTLYSRLLRVVESHGGSFTPVNLNKGEE
jgi:hypothetical protein